MEYKQRQLAEKIYKKWRVRVALKSTGYVSEPYFRGSSSSYQPTTTLYHHELYGRDEIDLFPFPEIKKCVLSLPFERSQWQGILQAHRRKGTKFEDALFPPNDKALYHNPAKPERSLKETVKKWVRISELFQSKCFMKFTFFLNSGMDLCGLESVTESDFERAEHDIAGRMQSASVQKAKDICIATLSASGFDDYTIPVFRGCTIIDWLKSHNFFASIAEAKQPYFFKDFGRLKVHFWEQVGYIGTVTIVAEVIFGPKLGTKLFAKDLDAKPGDNRLIKPGDVQQGNIGDCYFLGALSVLSLNEELLLNIFPDKNPKSSDPLIREQDFNEEGVYAVAFFKNRMRRIVIVDDYIPCNEAGKPVFAHPPGNSTEVWTLIAEKAFAKLNGSYESIIGGLEKEAMQDLTGGVPVSYHISGPARDIDDEWKGENGKEDFWLKINSLFNPEEPCLVGCSYSEESTVNCAHNIRKDHAYGVLKIDEFTFRGKTHRVLQIRNPWGCGVEWNGDWNDKDPIWKALPSEIIRRLGFTDEEDGTWFMSYDDFFATFNEVQVCYLVNQLPKIWTHHIANGRWKGINAGGCLGRIHLNPQFQLVLVKDCKVFIEIRQPNRRQTGGEVYPDAISPVVVKNCQLGKRKIVIKTEDVVSDLKMSHARSRVHELELKKEDGPFTIIPCTMDEGVEKEFYIDVYTKDGDVECIPCNNINMQKTEHTHSLLFALNDNDLPLCAHCNRLCELNFIQVDDSYVHKMCYDQFKAKVGTKCLKCLAPVCPIEQTFSGNYFSVEGQQRVHSECWEDYQKSTSMSCFQCKLPVCQYGEFSNIFYEVEEGKHRIHEKCWEDYRQSKSDKCKQCQMAVTRVANRFTGKYFMLQEGGKVHAECWDHFRRLTSPSCVACSGPCCELDGKSGNFYELEGDKKCHVECFSAYSMPQSS